MASDYEEERRLDKKKVEHVVQQTAAREEKLKKLTYSPSGERFSPPCIYFHSCDAGVAATLDRTIKMTSQGSGREK